MKKNNFEHYLSQAKLTTPFSVDSSWAQGRSLFGGLNAALILSHIEGQTGFTDKELRTVNIHFCAPITSEQEIRIECQVLSQGKSVFQVQGQLLQDGEVKTSILACFSAPRNSTIVVKHAPLVPALLPQQAKRFPYIPGVIPDFIQHMDLRFTSKAMPFTNSENSTMSGWMRMEEKPSEVSDAAIIAMIDAWPPAVLPMMKKPAPASTITWNIEFIHPRDSIKAEDYLYYQCQTIQAESGYAHTDGKIYHPNGQLLALSRQLVAIYDKPSAAASK